MSERPDLPLRVWLCHWAMRWGNYLEVSLTPNCNNLGPDNICGCRGGNQSCDQREAVLSWADDDGKLQAVRRLLATWEEHVRVYPWETKFLGNVAAELRRVIGPDEVKT